MIGRKDRIKESDSLDLQDHLSVLNMAFCAFCWTGVGWMKIDDSNRAKFEAYEAP